MIRTLSSHALRLIRAGFRLVTVLLLGFIGGWSLGFLFLFSGFAIGRSGNSGGSEEQVSVEATIAIFGLAGIYGGLLGALLFPIGYYAFLQAIPLQTTIRYTTIATTIGGLAGALLGPPLAAVFGAIAFFIGCAFATDAVSKESSRASP